MIKRGDGDQEGDGTLIKRGTVIKRAGGLPAIHVPWMVPGQLAKSSLYFFEIRKVFGTFL